MICFLNKFEPFTNELVEVCVGTPVLS